MENIHENTPKHCWTCWTFKNCHQAQQMTADTEAVDGYVVSELADGTYVGDHFCSYCLPTRWEDDASPIGNEEIDSPQHCCNCGVPLKHRLTLDGIEYVRESIKEAIGCTRELWPVIWADYLED